MSIPLLQFPKTSTSGPGPVSYQDWVASEKIHGAQLVIGVDATELRVGKRKAWLSAEESFFGWQMLRPLIQRAGRTIHHALGSIGTVWMYGELFGGHYPHPSVAAIPGLVPVQTGAWYAPDLHYAVFDIVHARDDQEPVFLSHERVEELAALAKLLTAPVLGRGHLSSLLQLPVRFPTRVPALLGLPALEKNFAEGYVLKHAAETPVSARRTVKKKIPEFDEQRFDESAAFDPNAHLGADALLTLATRLINPARMASARSKVGTDDSQVVEEAVLDALIDLRDMFPRRIETLTPAEEQELLANLEKRAWIELESAPRAQTT